MPSTLYHTSQILPTILLSFIVSVFIDEKLRLRKFKRLAQAITHNWQHRAAGPQTQALPMAPNCLSGCYHAPSLLKTSATPKADRRSQCVSHGLWGFACCYARVGPAHFSFLTSVGLCCFLSLGCSPSHPDLLIPQNPAQVHLLPEVFSSASRTFLCSFDTLSPTADLGVFVDKN